MGHINGNQGIMGEGGRKENIMEEQYRDYTIKYREVAEKFSARIGDSAYENKSLSAVKKYIDRADKKDFKREAVIVEDYRDYEFGTITSCIESTDPKNPDCWVIFNDSRKSRSKYSINRVYLDNENNRNILSEIKKKGEDIQAIEDEMKTLKLSLEGYKQP